MLASLKAVTLATMLTFEDVGARVVLPQIFFLFAIFILHSRKRELYRYIVDGTSALAWELPFPRCLSHLSST